MINRRMEKAIFLCLGIVLVLAGLFSGDAQAAVPDYNCALQDAVPEEQCLALVALYTSTGGTDWTVNTNWLESEDPCNWHGVSCVSGSVIALDLYDNNLTGLLPLEIGSFPDLETLTLNNNPLTGPVPLTVTLLDLRLFHFHNTGLCEPSDPTFQDWLFGVVYRFSTGEYCSPPATATLEPSGPTSTNAPESEPASTSDLPWPQQTLTAMAAIAETEQAEPTEVLPEQSPTPTKYYTLESPTPALTSEPTATPTPFPEEAEGAGGFFSGIPRTWLFLLLIPVGLIAVGLLLEFRERRKENEAFGMDDEVEEALFKLDYFDPNDDND